MVVSDVVSVRYAFRERRLGDARWEFVSFAGIGLCGLVLTQGLLRLLVGELGMSVLLATWTPPRHREPPQTYDLYACAQFASASH